MGQIAMRPSLEKMMFLTSRTPTCFWFVYHTWIWPFLLAGLVLFYSEVDYRKQSPEMCACVSSHLEDQVLISWFLAISKLAFTGTFTGTPLYFLGVTTWFTTKFAKQINSAIVPVKPEGSEISWHRYGADLHYVATGREAGWVKWLVFCGLVVYVGQ